MNFYDTNALLLLKDNILQDDYFIISDVTLYELEHIKTDRRKDEQTRYDARRVIRLLDRYPDKYLVMFSENNSELSPDEKICQCAEDYYTLCSEYKAEDAPEMHLTDPKDFTFVTGDISCKNIARLIYNLPVRSVFHEMERVYQGYKQIRGTSEEITNYIANIDIQDWHVNEYLLIENIETQKQSEMRWDGNQFVPLKLPSSKFIKGKNSLQRCALDLLNNPNIAIVAVLGSYGSGKSFLTTKMALYNVLDKGRQSKITLIREPIGTGEAVGYLKGTFEEKTDNFFMPIAQQLDGEEFELESLKQRGIIDATIPYYCKGLTFNDNIIVVDEAEDLTEKQIKLIGTRVGQGSRIFLSGDYKQSEINTSPANGLVKLVQALKGNDMFGCIYLGEDVRSEASKLFAHIFE